MIPYFFKDTYLMHILEFKFFSTSFVHFMRKDCVAIVHLKT